MMKITRRVHITMVDDQVRTPVGTMSTAMCGRRKRIGGPGTRSVFGFCPGCVEALMISHRARMLERNDAVTRCYEISMILNRPGAARREDPA